ncbi:signal transduction protein [Deferribacter desulfuricans SSM1]|uniref:Signal transduction protein n=1 Tax=Deferribacter desulfuricans (strain DSM 14783 / JCM 11476 / NBRC 101012 / SSM1) TaxID=639282 RepID=D3PE80_DEFDS|nr:CBS domain-containing protein [Deferribacter desulfuricans]BAI80903.1 signal transduction protein [Deferribacter desulfuricans SSM1]
MQTTVKDILAKKGNQIFTVSADSTVYDALKVMADNNIGSVLVMDGDKMVGIFTERDYARKLILKGKYSKDTPIKEVMTEKVISIKPEATTEACLALMTEKRIRHLPVMQDGKVIGLISIGDVVKQIIEDRESYIRDLERFITGDYAL